MLVYTVFCFETREDWSKEIFAWTKNKMSRTYSLVDLIEASVPPYALDEKPLYYVSYKV